MPITQAWWDHMRGAGDNVVIVGSVKCSSLPHYQHIPNKEELSDSTYHTTTIAATIVLPFC